jgi:2-polyprenyl-3-methyl-5-hydroxy-6-metoxy-1,4-benzoquinol methylase
MVEALEPTLDLSADSGANLETRVALIGCYRDLMRLECANLIENAAAASQNEAFVRLVKNTISIPAEVRACHKSIPVLSSPQGSTRHPVSSAVAKQYEENPYPRWRYLDIPVLNEKQRAKGRGKRILIAGCGTGHEALVMATRYPEARILGIDLSVPSLAYGKQKADEFAIGNVEFLQADILDLESLGQQFDLITCSGVLHHMQDPVEGWRKLLGRLKPDGFMKIALYSELARQPVVLCRKWIQERGFASTPEGIRDFRQAILALDDENPLKDIVNWADFFSMSMCRDLVFHVQEHRVTLPWIKSALEDLHLCCLSMRISNPLLRKAYLSRFPGDRGLQDLDKLHEYETDNPETFRDMYQFWCCRKGSANTGSPPAWLHTAGR